MSDELVVACTLGTEDLSVRARRWVELRRRAEIGQKRTTTGKSIRFRADEGVAKELEELVAVERECCSWATWSLERADGELVLDVKSTGAGVAAIHVMFSPGGR